MYTIPKNVRTRYEIFPGFGFRELLITATGSLIGIAVFFLMSLFKLPIPLTIILSVIFPAAAFLLSMPNPRTNVSLLIMIKHFRTYRARQNRYFYVFGGGRINEDY